jgi:hypothetical protein
MQVFDKFNGPVFDFYITVILGDSCLQRQVNQKKDWRSGKSIYLPIK